MKKDELIQSPSDVRPHVVLLGAGASLAAFPNGDRTGYRLPLMSDLVRVIGLEPILEQAGGKFGDEGNFESIYSKLASNPKHQNSMKEIEGRIREYFSSLSIPSSTTLYDYLLLSLRRKDAIFTFNWDPFLFDAYLRNSHIATLPQIFFLHGNVRIGMCPSHPERWGRRKMQCPDCLEPLKDVPLLYPIEQKDYSKHLYIKRSWEEARFFFREAFNLTIFGYSAPDSDAEAVNLLKKAWMERSDRKIEHIEIIDKKPYGILYEHWKPFLPTGHLNKINCLHESWIMRYPRRSVEALRQSVLFGKPAEQFPLFNSSVLYEVQTQILDIVTWEQSNGLNEK